MTGNDLVNAYNDRYISIWFYTRIIKIADEERVHAGEFLRLLKELAPDEQKLYDKGAKEIKE